ncbi:GAF domain-containing protein [Streptomyces sp. NPDC046197]|uniref:GAF domain-containing protein n=1 Tax=Streptomyces sp. NPDC046197 TaxID=3154337 RepID=UPI0033E9A50C
MNREQQLAEALVGLADSVADDIDPVVLVERLARNCSELTGADAVGIMVATVRGDLRTLAVTDDQTAFLELFQLQIDEGPCIDCYREGRRIDARDLNDGRDRWPHVAPFARRMGYQAVHALPLRVHHQTIGAVNLLFNRPGGLTADDLNLAQALSDVTAVALVNWSPDPLRPSDIRTSVQAALSAKATVDMASGMLAEHGGFSPSEARSALRGYAIDHHRRLIDAAHDLVRRHLAPDDVLAARR